MTSINNHQSTFYRSPTPLRESELNEVSKVVAKAFLHTPSYVEIFRGSDEEKQYHLQELFQRNLSMVQSKATNSIHCYYTDDSRQELVCSFMLVPANLEFSLWDKIVHGLLTLLFIYGWTTFMRLIYGADHHDDLFAKIMQGRPHLQVQRMIVNPAMQGKGLGSKLLGEALKEADRQGLPVVLGTQEERNVTFYTRL